MNSEGILDPLLEAAAAAAAAAVSVAAAAAAAAAALFLEAEPLFLELSRRINDLRRCSFFTAGDVVGKGGDVDEGVDEVAPLTTAASPGTAAPGLVAAEGEGEGEGYALDVPAAASSSWCCEGGGVENGDSGRSDPRLECRFGRTCDTGPAELLRSKLEVARLGRATCVALPCADQKGVGVDPRDDADSDDP